MPAPRLSRWIEVCIKEDLPAITDLEDGLRNGVFLAKLARFFSKESVKRIYDEASVRRSAPPSSVPHARLRFAAH